MRIYIELNDNGKMSTVILKRRIIVMILLPDTMNFRNLWSNSRD